mgnify:FL=1
MMLRPQPLPPGSSILCTVVVVVLTWVLVPPSHAQLKDEVSSITGTHRIASESLRDVLIRSYDGNDAGLRAAYESSDTDGESWILSLYGFADSPTGLASANVQLTVDGSPVRPLRMNGRTRAFNGSTLEIRSLVFSRPVFVQIAQGSTVKVTAGSAAFELSKYARRDMQRILDRVLPADGRRTASSDSGSTGG